MCWEGERQEAALVGLHVVAERPIGLWLTALRILPTPYRRLRSVVSIVSFSRASLGKV